MWAYTVGFTVLPHVGGFLGWLMNRTEIPILYEKLKKPSWCPPLKIFPVAWTVLYTGMGYASYLIWNDLGGCNSKAVIPLGLYGAQLALNWAWPHFFGAHNLKMVMYGSPFGSLAAGVPATGLREGFLTTCKESHKKSFCPDALHTVPGSRQWYQPLASLALLMQIAHPARHREQSAAPS
uniref:Translocator protein 2 n=1 Tax=Amazona collaria TaxID=241587 RepID=A0A8B9FIS7_9PSIT